MLRMDNFRYSKTMRSIGLEVTKTATSGHIIINWWWGYTVITYKNGDFSGER